MTRDDSVELILDSRTMSAGSGQPRELRIGQGRTGKRNGGNGSGIKPDEPTCRRQGVNPGISPRPRGIEPGCQALGLGNAPG
jgi:hypothetical protein